MSLCFSRKARISSAERVTRVGGIRSRKSSTKIFSGELRTLAGSLTTSVSGMVRGDIGQVEGRILAKMHHVEGAGIHFPWMREPVVVSGLVLHGETMALGDQLAVAEREIVARVVEHVMP